MQWIVSSSVLILVVIALRYVLRGKLSLRMQYALWLLVLVRLLVPVSFGAVTVAVVTFCTRFGGAASFMLCAGMPTVSAFAGASFRSPTMSCL